MGMARAYATGAAKGIRPKRTMIFLWVAGEEKGLWGSQYFNQFPPVDITKVVADLNMDMVGRSKTPGYVDPPSYKLADVNEVFVVGPRVASDDMGKILETVNSSYLKLKISDFYDTVVPDETHDNLGPGTNGQRIFYRSDHYNFVKMGIPIAFFCDGLHSDYHRVTDSAGEDRLRQDRGRVEDGVRRQLGPRELGHTAEAEREAARAARERHEDGEGPGLGQADAGDRSSRAVGKATHPRQCSACGGRPQAGSL